jgi:hypothetical protein
MQFHKINEINILNKMVRTFQKSYASVLPNINPEYKNNLNKMDNKKPRLLNVILVKIFV